MFEIEKGYGIINIAKTVTPKGPIFYEEQVLLLCLK